MTNLSPVYRRAVTAAVEFHRKTTRPITVPAAGRCRDIDASRSTLLALLRYGLLVHNLDGTSRPPDQPGPFAVRPSTEAYALWTRANPGVAERECREALGIGPDDQLVAARAHLAAKASRDLLAATSSKEARAARKRIAAYTGPIQARRSCRRMRREAAQHQASGLGVPYRGRQ